MKLESLAYFLSFGIFVPIASYLIVYGLYLVRVYFFENVVADSSTRVFQQHDNLYDKVQNILRSKVTRSPPPDASSPPPQPANQGLDEEAGQAGVRPRKSALVVDGGTGRSGRRVRSEPDGLMSFEVPVLMADDGQAENNKRTVLETRWADDTTQQKRPSSH